MQDSQNNSSQKRYAAVEDHGIIGDLRTAALVGVDGSIDFMCFPEFDSPSIFCANADADQGGRFQLQLNIFGEVMDSVYLFDKYGTQISQKLWASLRKVLGYVCEHWQDADAGISAGAGEARGIICCLSRHVLRTAIV